MWRVGTTIVLFFAVLACEPVDQPDQPKPTKTKTTKSQTYHTAGELCYVWDQGEESVDTHGRTLICKLYTHEGSLNGKYVWQIK